MSEPTQDRPGYVAPSGPLPTNSPFAGVAGEVVNPEYGEPDENGFVGVSPEYSNAANETDEPHNVEGDKVVELGEVGVNNQFEYEDAVNGDDGSGEGEDEADDEDKTQGGQKLATKTAAKAQAKRLADQQKDSSES